MTQHSQTVPPLSSDEGKGTNPQVRGNGKERATAAVQSSRLVNQSPVYYGWIILVAAGIGIIMTSPGQTYSVSIFIDH